MTDANKFQQIMNIINSCSTHDHVFVCVRWLERLQKINKLADNEVRVLKSASLNKRAEIAKKCRHEMDQNKYLPQ